VGEDYVIRRLKALERRVDELGPSLMLAVADAISTVTTQQEILATTVAHLATAQVDIVAAQVDIVAAQVDIVAAQALLTKTQSYQLETSGGFGVTSTYTTVLTQSITVPTGYSKVDLVTLGTVMALSNSATATYMHGLIVVNGVAGTSVIDGPIVGTVDLYGTVTPGDARTITGVSGVTFDVNLQVNKEAGPDWATSVASRGKLSILAIFRN
jgi:hypothetical protein